MEEADEFTSIMGLAILLKNLQRGKKKCIRKSTWDSAKAKMNLEKICCEAMCIFERNVIRVSDSRAMTLSKCHVMKAIQ